MSDKQALPGKRTNLFLMDPDDLTIIGVDGQDETESVKAHSLYDERAFLPLEEPMVLNIMTYGVIEPITVAREGDATVAPGGTTAVMRAARYGDERAVVPLLERGADAKLKDPRGMSATDFERGGGREPLAQRLDQAAGPIKGVEPAPYRRVVDASMSRMGRR